MVRRFKKMHDAIPDFPVSEESAEEELGRHFPWYQRVGESWRYFGCCPRCNNPVKLVSLYSTKRTPHGRHEDGPVRGFDYFNLEDMRSCATNLPRYPARDERRSLTPLSKAIIGAMVDDFDRAVRILSESVGFRISKDLASELLAAWFDARAYSYVGASLTNVPWMLAYFSPTRSMIGRYIHDNVGLIERIRDRVPNAEVTGEGRLIYRTRDFVSVTFEFIRHEVVNGSDGSSEEKMTMRVETTNERDAMPVTLLRQIIKFDDVRFPSERSGIGDGGRRNNILLQIARDMADQRLGEGWRDD